MPSRGHCAVFLRHVELLGFILKLLSDHFGSVLASCCALCWCPDAIPWPLCILLMPCRAVDVILELLSGYFGGILTSCCALCSRPDATPVAIARDFAAVLRCWDSFGGIVWLSWAHFGIILSFILASTSHYVAIVHDFATMLRCWDSF